VRIAARERTKLLIADHDPLARQAVRQAIASRDDLEVVAESASSIDALATLVDQLPDVILLDAALPPQGGVTATGQLLAVAPDVHIILFAIQEDPELAFAALEAGAAGFLSKDIEMRALARSVRSVARGEAAISRRLAALTIMRMRGMSAQLRGMRPVHSVLTNRQWEVLELMARGHTRLEMAERLSVSPDTVRGHVRMVLRSLGARTPAEAVKVAHRLRAGVPAA
jgi:DNA-binding NarL/FixJ family response regulator